MAKAPWVYVHMPNKQTCCPKGMRGLLGRFFIGILNGPINVFLKHLSDTPSTSGSVEFLGLQGGRCIRIKAQPGGPETSWIMEMCISTKYSVDEILPKLVKENTIDKVENNDVDGEEQDTASVPIATELASLDGRLEEIGAEKNRLTSETNQANARCVSLREQIAQLWIRIKELEAQDVEIRLQGKAAEEARQLLITEEHQLQKRRMQLVPENGIEEVLERLAGKEVGEEDLHLLEKLLQLQLQRTDVN